MPRGQAATIRRPQRTLRTKDPEGTQLLDIAGKPPPRRSELVERSLLVQGLAEDDGAALVLMVAPPGYGKSTALAQWAQHDQRPFVWLALAEHDSSPLCSAGSSPPRSVRGGLAQLVRRTARRHRNFVVVLDDADRLHPAVMRPLVEGVLKELPADSVVALSSRTELALPLGRLRAHRLVREIRMEQLAMTPAEATGIFRQAGVEPEHEVLRALLDTTEGWPAALYLAALALREDPERWNEFGGHHYLFSDYLRDDVFANLPTELERFALHTAVLNELSGPLCDAVLERQGSAAAIGELAALTPLLIPIDLSHRRYRWHTLMGQALGAELQRAHPELEHALRLRAGRWYCESGERIRAIDQMAAAGETRVTGDLIWREILADITAGRTQQVRGWLSNFSPSQLADDPALALSASLSALASGNMHEAERWSLTAAAAVERNGAKHTPASLGTGLAVTEAVTCDSVSAMAEVATTAMRSEPKDSLWRPLCLMLSAVGSYLRGDRTDAALRLDEATRLGGNRAPSISSMCLSQRAMMAIEQEEWEPATEQADRALAVIEEWGLTRDPLSALAFAAAAASLAHQGRIDEAKRHLRCGIDLLAELGDFIPWYGAETRILLAGASLSLADAVAARTLLAEASRLARRIPDAVVFSEWFDRAWAHLDTLAETTLAGPSSLTIAELRILRFLPSHRSFREIAAQLGVSANTVKTQAHAVYRKLGVASRSEAVSQAMDAGLLCQ